MKIVIYLLHLYLFQIIFASQFLKTFLLKEITPISSWDTKIWRLLNSMKIINTPPWMIPRYLFYLARDKTHIVLTLTLKFERYGKLGDLVKQVLHGSIAPARFEWE
jgi:hypothetical protein